MENHQQGPLENEIPPVIQESAQGGDTYAPGQTPDEIVPDQGGSFDRPGGSPLEQPPQEGDSDQLGEMPQEVPQHPANPNEAPPPD